MRFQQYGKTYQLKIETADELDDIISLDESLWVATSAPTAAFRCDPRFTGFLDGNGCGRVKFCPGRGRCCRSIPVSSRCDGI